MTRLIIGNVVNRKVLGRDDDGDDWGDESLVKDYENGPFFNTSLNNQATFQEVAEKIYFQQY